MRTLALVALMLMPSVAWAGAASVTDGPRREGGLIVWTIEATDAAAGQIDTLIVNTRDLRAFDNSVNFVSQIIVAAVQDTGDSVLVTTDYSVDGTVWTAFYTAFTMSGSVQLFTEVADKVPRWMRFRLENTDEDAHSYTLTCVGPRGY
jgi:hypothetical protein